MRLGKGKFIYYVISNKKMLYEDFMFLELSYFFYDLFLKLFANFK